MVSEFDTLLFSILDRGQLKEALDIMTVYTRERLRSPIHFETWRNSIMGEPYHEPVKSRYPTNRK